MSDIEELQVALDEETLDAEFWYLAVRSCVAVVIQTGGTNAACNLVEVVHESAIRNFDPEATRAAEAAYDISPTFLEGLMRLSHRWKKLGFVSQPEPAVDVLSPLETQGEPVVSDIESDLQLVQQAAASKSVERLNAEANERLAELLAAVRQAARSDCFTEDWQKAVEASERYVAVHRQWWAIVHPTLDYDSIFGAPAVRTGP